MAKPEMALVFEPVPPRKPRRSSGKTGKGRWQKVARKLEQRPGEWARLDGIFTNTEATNIGRQLRIAGCETERRGERDGKFQLWARYPREDA